MPKKPHEKPRERPDPIAAKPQEAPKPELAPPEPLPSDTRPLPERESYKAGDRVSFKVTDTGKLDISSVRQSSAPKVREVFKACLQDEEVRKWLGIEQALTPQQIEEIFSPEQMGMVLDVLVKVEIIFATASTKLPSEECDKFLAISPREHEILDKQGARVVAKYIPREWLERIDLWLFLLSLVSISVTKFARLNQHARQVHKQTKEQIDRIENHPEEIRETPPRRSAPVSPQPVTIAVPESPQPLSEIPRVDIGGIVDDGAAA